MTTVQLEDTKWYPCKITGSSVASDYIGDRINVVLTKDITVKPKEKKEYSLKIGHKFYECHHECVRG